MRLPQRVLGAGLCDAAGTIRLRIARARGRNFLPTGWEKFERWAEEVAMLIREAFLRGISTRQVGRIVATFTGEPVSAQTVSKLTRELDQAVRKFHQAPLNLFLDGVSLRVRRPAGRKRVQRLVAYGVRRDGRRQLLAFQRSSGESQAAWEGLLQDLYRRGLVSFFRFPKPLWRQLRTTNIMERVFVEVRRRTRPMVCFVNVASVDRIIYSIFQRFNLEWRNRTLRVFTQTA